MSVTQCGELRCGVTGRLSRCGEQCSDVQEGLGLCVHTRCQGCVRGWILLGRNDVAQTGQDGVGSGAGWDWDLGGEPCDSVTGAHGSSFPDPDLVTPIGIHVRSYVPPVQGMGGTGGTSVRPFVDEDVGAGWAKGGAVIIEGPVDLCPRRELGVHPGAMQEVQRDLRLWDKVVPQV
jgi:hypothetical protein